MSSVLHFNTSFMQAEMTTSNWRGKRNKTYQVNLSNTKLSETYQKGRTIMRDEKSAFLPKRLDLTFQVIV